MGLEIALHALMHPDQEVSARRIASDTAQEPRWHPGDPQPVRGRGADRIRHSAAPVAGSVLGDRGALARRRVDRRSAWRSPRQPRWWVPGELLRVDERAATLGGARIAAAADLPARCYVGKDGLRRLRALGPPGREERRVFVRLAPVRWLPELEGLRARRQPSVADRPSAVVCAADRR